MKNLFILKNIFILRKFSSCHTGLMPLHILAIFHPEAYESLAVLAAAYKEGIENFFFLAREILFFSSKMIIL